MHHNRSVLTKLAREFVDQHSRSVYIRRHPEVGHLEPGEADAVLRQKGLLFLETQPSALIDREGGDDETDSRRGDGSYLGLEDIGPGRWRRGQSASR